MIRQPSLFESFNARALRPEQVGKGFIFSPAFVEVAAKANTVVLGPRGSGKTTLLKMLTLPALRNWHKRAGNKESAQLIAQLDFIAIYVPSDFTWYPDFRRPIMVKPPKEIDDLLSYALFRNHVLLAMCETLDHMASPDLRSDEKLRRFALDSDELKADSLTKLLADSWDVQLNIGGFYGLKRAVAARIRQIQHLLTLTAIKATSVDALVGQNQFLSATFFDDLREFADAFEHVYGRKLQWAACFDEVEIAPDPVKLPIWQSGRSFDPRYLIKLSASPYDADLAELLHPRMPMAGHDFREVDLSLQSRQEIFRFSQRMFAGICSDFKINPAKAEIMLGSSFYDDSFDAFNDEAGASPSTSVGRSVSQARFDRLAPSGFYKRKFQSLAAKDPSFAAYLKKRNIDLDAMAALPEFRKAALIRKILSTIVVRDEFLFEKPVSSGESARDRRFRARKMVPRIYTGALSLFTICEGNPRWLIGLLRPLISEFSIGSDDGGSRTIPRSLQAKRIERTITTFFTLLSTLRMERDTAEQISIIELVERLGDFCFDQVMGETFNPEPVLSFIVDKAVSPGVYSAVGRALNQGALVLIPRKIGSKENTSALSFGPGDIWGRRVRLTFLLAPRYRLPLVLGRAVDMSPVIAGRSPDEFPDQLILSDLFSMDAGTGS